MDVLHKSEWWLTPTPVNIDTAWRCPLEANFLFCCDTEDFHFRDRRPPYRRVAFAMTTSVVRGIARRCARRGRRSTPQ
jgi:hypothetical protein